MILSKSFPSPQHHFPILPILEYISLSFLFSHNIILSTNWSTQACFQFPTLVNTKANECTNMMTRAYFD